MRPVAGPVGRNQPSYYQRSKAVLSLHSFASSPNETDADARRRRVGRSPSESNRGLAGEASHSRQTLHLRPIQPATFPVCVFVMKTTGRWTGLDKFTALLTDSLGFTTRTSLSDLSTLSEKPCPSQRTSRGPVPGTTKESHLRPGFATRSPDGRRLCASWGWTFSGLEKASCLLPPDSPHGTTHGREALHCFPSNPCIDLRQATAYTRHAAAAVTIAHHCLLLSPHSM